METKPFIGKINRLAKRSLTVATRPFGPRAIWKANLHTEVDFWDDYFATKGGRWSENYLAKLDPDSELDPELAGFLSTDGRPADVLDVGAGPLTVLGKKCNGHPIHLVAVDPLAPAYDKIMKKYGVTPPVRTISGDAETLTSQFDFGSFDLVHAQNCIDHSYSPEDAIVQMIKVVRMGGFVVLRHSANEAVKEGYEGLHQWNLSVKDGDFIISSRTTEVNFTEKYAKLCHVTCRELEDDWILTVIERRI